MTNVCVQKFTKSSMFLSFKFVYKLCLHKKNILKICGFLWKRIALSGQQKLLLLPLTNCRAANIIIVSVPYCYHLIGIYNIIYISYLISYIYQHHPIIVKVCNRLWGGHTRTGAESPPRPILRNPRSGFRSRKSYDAEKQHTFSLF